MEETKQNQRELDPVSNPEKIRLLIQTQLEGKTVSIKGAEPPAEAQILKLNPNGTILVDFRSFKFDINRRITFFKMLSRYVQLECMTRQKESGGNRYIVSIERAAIARKERAHLRMPVNEKEVYATNFRVRKDTLDISEFNIPASIKVGFSIHEQKLKHLADYVKIDVFGFTGRDPLLEEIRRSSKPFLVTHTQKEEAYAPPEGGFIDYAEILNDTIRPKMKEYAQKSILSELIAPVLYKDSSKSVAAGYIHLQSKSRHFTADDARKMMRAGEEIIDRIKDSNSLLIEERQKIINLSRGGLKLRISNPDLKKHLMNHAEFTFDVVFRMQAPVTLFGRIRASFQNMQQELTLGVEIGGNSSRTGEMKRYLDNSTTMEQKLKKVLLERKQMLDKMKARSAPNKTRR